MDTKHVLVGRLSTRRYCTVFCQTIFNYPGKFKTLNSEICAIFLGIFQNHHSIKMIFSFWHTICSKWSKHYLLNLGILWCTHSSQHRCSLAHKGLVSSTYKSTANRIEQPTVTMYTWAQSSTHLCSSGTTSHPFCNELKWHLIQNELHYLTVLLWLNAQNSMEKIEAVTSTKGNIWDFRWNSRWAGVYKLLGNSVVLESTLLMIFYYKTSNTYRKPLSGLPNPSNTFFLRLSVYPTCCIWTNSTIHMDSLCAPFSELTSPRRHPHLLYWAPTLVLVLDMSKASVHLLGRHGPKREWIREEERYMKYMKGRDRKCVKKERKRKTKR